MKGPSFSLVDRGRKLVTNRKFWLVGGMFAIGTLFHYGGQIRYLPLAISGRPFFSTRHAMERVLFVLPIAYAAFSFGWVGGLVALLIALVVMVPRALLFSAQPVDAALEILAVMVVGGLVSWMVEKEEKEKRLRQEAVSRLEATGAVSSIVTQSLELRQILGDALDKVLEVMDLQGGAVFILDEGGQGLSLATHRGLPVELTEGADVLKLARMMVRDKGLRGHLSVLLQSKGKVEGVLIVGGREPRQFLPEEVELITVIGNQIGVAIENARLYKAEQRRAQELAMLNTIASAVSQSLDLDAILDRALGKVIEETRLQARGGVFLLDTEGQKLHLRVHRGLPAEFVEQEGEVAVGECLCGLVAESGEVLLGEDLSEDIRHTRMGHLEPHSHVIVPLRSREKVLGVMFLYPESAYRPNAEDREFFTSIGNQIGVAVENAKLHQDVARQLDIERSLNEVAEKITSELELTKVLPKILEIAEGLVGGQGGDIALLDEEREVVTYPYLHNVPPELSNVIVPKGRGLAGEVMTVGRPIVVEDYRSYPQAIEAFVEAGLKSVVAVPIVSGEKIFGALSVFSLSQTKRFSERDVALLAGVGRQAGIAIENARLYENMHSYVRQITRAQEEERKRIARDLHDDTAQALVALSRGLDALLTSPDPLPRPAIERLEELRRIAESISQGVRRFSRDLRPSILDDLGLLPTLEALNSTLTEEDGIKAELRVVGERRRLSLETGLVLFRIIQEALNNVKKHSQASEVVTTVEFADDAVLITVSDSGKGFELPSRTSDLAAAGKLGLIGMRERAQLIGGSLTVRSKPGQGTIVTAKVPG